MSLTKIVAEVTEAHEVEGVINRHEAINDAVPRVLADSDLTETCVRSHLSRMIATNAKARTRERSSANDKQIGLFGLRDAYVLTDGEGSIKLTRALSRIEFAALIKVRQQQVDADIAHLDRLRAAALETSPIWNAHPDWCWGQVEDAYSRLRGIAA